MGHPQGLFEGGLLLLLAVSYAFSLLIDLIWKWIEKAFHPR